MKHYVGAVCIAMMCAAPRSSPAAPPAANPATVQVGTAAVTRVEAGSPLRAMPVAVEPGRPGPSSRGEPLKSEILLQVLPGVQVFARIARRWPVAHNEKSCVTFVDAKGTATEVTDEALLKTFVMTNFPPVQNAVGAKQAVRAWLLLIAPLVNDGFFRFETDEASLNVSPAEGPPTRARGVAKVSAGGRGHLTVVMTFDQDGRIAGIESEATLEEGVRPICQSTKLLDPDPVVRGMARQDLLAMGVAAKPYLDEMRPKLLPELQEAVDAIWQEILRREKAFGGVNSPATAR